MADSKAFFYIVQPMPQDAPRIVKLGYARDLGKRLRTYRTLCPLATVLASWESKIHHERAAIRYITSNTDCKALGKEVFRCKNLTALLARAEQFFSLDGDTLEKLAATAGRSGGGAVRLTQAEMLQRLRDYQAGAYIPRDKYERRVLKAAVQRYLLAGVLI
jgi:hypothetical protein